MRKLASIQKVAEIRPIEGADKIEALRINGWWVVSQKGNFVEGDLCVYFEIDSLLPDEPQFAFLKKGSTLKRIIIDGEEVTGIRLKTIKLRGQVSQGLAMPMSEVGVCAEVGEGDDLTESLGIHKYEKPISADLAGKAKGGFPTDIIPKTDEERVQNMPELFNGYYVTEKLDGSSVTFYKHEGKFGVCSRNLELLEDGGGTQWKLARSLDLENKIPDGMAFQGELVGPGVQGNKYNLTEHKVYFYNVYKIEGGFYLDLADFQGFMLSVGLPTVPLLDLSFAITDTVEAMLEYAEGKSVINEEVEREGVVVRSKKKRNGQRISFKAISNKFLLNE